MAWVTWRQHRLALAGAAALLGALAAWVLIVGLHLHHAHAVASACHPATSAACVDRISGFNGMDLILRLRYALQAVPALIGAFVGAPVLAREFEAGTYRYTWTQGFGRWRWSLAKLVLLGAAVAAAAGAFSVLLSWYYQPYFDAGNQSRTLVQASPLDPGLFGLRGVAFAAWTLAAFAIGGFAGVLIRRVVPAIVAALVMYAGLALAAGMYLRQHYLTPLVTSHLTVPASAWVTSQWGTRGGRVAFSGHLPPLDLLPRNCPPPTPLGQPKPSITTIGQCLTQHGFTLWTAYQPASRFWTFQWIEAGWLLALSALLIAVTVWMVRRPA
jgi:hypothetical protein